MRVLVTGGAGYIGSHLVSLLLEAGADVVTVDDLSMGHSSMVDPRAELIQETILHTERLREIIHGRAVEGVVHMAARALVGEDRREPAGYYRTNVGGTLSLLDAVRDSTVRKVVISSTCAVYGEPKTEMIDEAHPRLPISVYGETKLAMENAVRAYSERYGFEYAALRYFNAAGAARNGSKGELHEPETHLIPRAIRAAIGGEDESFAIFGGDYPTPDGTAIRDYVHVEDLGRAHILALDKDGSFEINLGTGGGHSVKDVVTSVRKLTQTDFEPPVVPRRTGDPAQLIASNRRAREILGWAPEISFEETVKTAVKWEEKRLKAKTRHET